MVNRPCGFFNESYSQEFIIVRTPTQWVFLLCALAFLFTMPMYASGSILNIANYAGITIMAVLGLHVLMGYCGQMSIGQSAFMAVGAYVSAILMRETGVSFWIALPCAAIATGIIGIIVGLPSLPRERVLPADVHTGGPANNSLDFRTCLAGCNRWHNGHRRPINQIV